MWDKLLGITNRDPRYTMNAYRFVFEALSYTVNKLGKNLKSPCESERHVTGQQLLEGIRELAMDQMGYMAPTVFELWGVMQNEDFGEIVFNLVEGGLMGKTETDSRRDFKSNNDYRTFFEENFKFEGNYNIKFIWDYTWQKK